MHVAVVFMGDHAFRVVFVLHFHASETTHVHELAEVLPSRDTLANIHVKVKCLICFVLAICNASLLLLGLCGFKLGIDAVLVALIEQELGQGERLE